MSRSDRTPRRNRKSGKSNIKEDIAYLQKVRRYVDVALKADAPQKAKNKHHDIDR